MILVMAQPVSSPLKLICVQEAICARAAPGSVAQRSRQALRWLEKAQQGSDSVIRGQSARDRKKVRPSGRA